MDLSALKAMRLQKQAEKAASAAASSSAAGPGVGGGFPSGPPPQSSTSQNSGISALKAMRMQQQQMALSKSPQPAAPVSVSSNTLPVAQPVQEPQIQNQIQTNRSQQQPSKSSSSKSASDISSIQMSDGLRPKSQQFSQSQDQSQTQSRSIVTVSNSIEPVTSDGNSTALIDMAKISSVDIFEPNQNQNDDQNDNRPNSAAQPQSQNLFERPGSSGQPELGGGPPSKKVKNGQESDINKGNDQSNPRPQTADKDSTSISESQSQTVENQAPGFRRGDSSASNRIEEGDLNLNEVIDIDAIDDTITQQKLEVESKTNSESDQQQKVKLEEIRAKKEKIRKEIQSHQQIQENSIFSEDNHTGSLSAQDSFSVRDPGSKDQEAVGSALAADQQQQTHKLQFQTRNAISTQAFLDMDHLPQVLPQKQFKASQPQNLTMQLPTVTSLNVTSVTSQSQQSQQAQSKAAFLPPSPPRPGGPATGPPPLPQRSSIVGPPPSSKSPTKPPPPPPQSKAYPINSNTSKVAKPGPGPPASAKAQQSQQSQQVLIQQEQSEANAIPDSLRNWASGTDKQLLIRPDTGKSSQEKGINLEESIKNTGAGGDNNTSAVDIQKAHSIVQEAQKLVPQKSFKTVPLGLIGTSGRLQGGAIVPPPPPPPPQIPSSSDTQQQQQQSLNRHSIKNLKLNISDPTKKLNTKSTDQNLNITIPPPPPPAAAAAGTSAPTSTKTTQKSILTPSDVKTVYQNFLKLQSDNPDNLLYQDSFVSAEEAKSVLIKDLPTLNWDSLITSKNTIDVKVLIVFLSAHTKVKPKTKLRFAALFLGSGEDYITREVAETIREGHRAFHQAYIDQDADEFLTSKVETNVELHQRLSESTAIERLWGPGPQGPGPKQQDQSNSKVQDSEELEEKQVKIETFIEAVLPSAGAPPTPSNRDSKKSGKKSKFFDPNGRKSDRDSQESDQDSKAGTKTSKSGGPQQQYQQFKLKSQAVGGLTIPTPPQQTTPAGPLLVSTTKFSNQSQSPSKDRANLSAQQKSGEALTQTSDMPPAPGKILVEGKTLFKDHTKSQSQQQQSDNVTVIDDKPPPPPSTNQNLNSSQNLNLSLSQSQSNLNMPPIPALPQFPSGATQTPSQQARAAGKAIPPRFLTRDIYRKGMDPKTLKKKGTDESEEDHSDKGSEGSKESKDSKKSEQSKKSKISQQSSTKPGESATVQEVADDWANLIQRKDSKTSRGSKQSSKVSKKSEGKESKISRKSKESKKSQQSKKSFLKEKLLVDQDDREQGQARPSAAQAQQPGAVIISTDEETAEDESSSTTSSDDDDESPKSKYQYADDSDDDQRYDFYGVQKTIEREKGEEILEEYRKLATSPNKRTVRFAEDLQEEQRIIYEDEVYDKDSPKVIQLSQSDDDDDVETTESPDMLHDFGELIDLSLASRFGHIKTVDQLPTVDREQPIRIQMLSRRLAGLSMNMSVTGVGNIGRAGGKIRSKSQRKLDRKLGRNVQTGNNGNENNDENKTNDAQANSNLLDTQTASTLRSAHLARRSPFLPYLPKDQQAEIDKSIAEQLKLQVKEAEKQKRQEDAEKAQKERDLKGRMEMREFEKKIGQKRQSQSPTKLKTVKENSSQQSTSGEQYERDNERIQDLLLDPDTKPEDLDPHHFSSLAEQAYPEKLKNVLQKLKQDEVYTSEYLDQLNPNNLKKVQMITKNNTTKQSNAMGYQKKGNSTLQYKKIPIGHNGSGPDAASVIVSADTFKTQSLSQLQLDLAFQEDYTRLLESSLDKIKKEKFRSVLDSAYCHGGLVNDKTLIDRHIDKKKLSQHVNRQLLRNEMKLQRQLSDGSLLSEVQSDSFSTSSRPQSASSQPGKDRRSNKATSKSYYSDYYGDRKVSRAYSYDNIDNNLLVGSSLRDLTHSKRRARNVKGEKNLKNRRPRSASLPGSASSSASKSTKTPGSSCGGTSGSPDSDIFDNNNLNESKGTNSNTGASSEPDRPSKWGILDGMQKGDSLSSTAAQKLSHMFELVARKKDENRGIKRYEVDEKTGKIRSQSDDNDNEDKDDFDSPMANDKNGIKPKSKDKKKSKKNKSSASDSGGQESMSPLSDRDGRPRNDRTRRNKKERMMSSSQSAPGGTRSSRSRSKGGGGYSSSNKSSRTSSRTSSPSLRSESSRVDVNEVNSLSDIVIRMPPNVIGKTERQRLLSKYLKEMGSEEFVRQDGSLSGKSYKSYQGSSSKKRGLSLFKSKKKSSSKSQSSQSSGSDTGNSIKLQHQKWLDELSSSSDEQDIATDINGNVLNRRLNPTTIREFQQDATVYSAWRFLPCHPDTPKRIRVMIFCAFLFLSGGIGIFQWARTSNSVWIQQDPSNRYILLLGSGLMCAMGLGCIILLSCCFDFNNQRVEKKIEMRRMKKEQKRIRRMQIEAEEKRRRDEKERKRRIKRGEEVELLDAASPSSFDDTLPLNSKKRKLEEKKRRAFQASDDELRQAGVKIDENGNNVRTITNPITGEILQQNQPIVARTHAEEQAIRYKLRADIIRRNRQEYQEEWKKQVKEKIKQKGGNTEKLSDILGTRGTVRKYLVEYGKERITDMQKNEMEMTDIGNLDIDEDSPNRLKGDVYRYANQNLYEDSQNNVNNSAVNINNRLIKKSGPGSAESRFNNNNPGPSVAITINDVKQPLDSIAEEQLSGGGSPEKVKGVNSTRKTGIVSDINDGNATAKVLGITLDKDLNTATSSNRNSMNFNFDNNQKLKEAASAKLKSTEQQPPTSQSVYIDIESNLGFNPADLSPERLAKMAIAKKKAERDAEEANNNVQSSNSNYGVGGLRGGTGLSNSNTGPGSESAGVSPLKVGGPGINPNQITNQNLSPTKPPEKKNFDPSSWRA